MLDTVGSGQYAICIGCNTNGVAILTRRRARRSRYDRECSRSSLSSARSASPRTRSSPNAAKLFVEFLLSEEAQQMMEENTDVMSARADFESKFAEPEARSERPSRPLR